MVQISDELKHYITDDSWHGIIEVSSYPDSGTSTACIKLLAGYADTHPDDIATILYAEHNRPDAEYLSALMGKKRAGQLLVAFYGIQDYSEFDLIKSLADICKVWVIDDFYNCLLYKNHAYIRNLMRGLKMLCDEYGLKIIIVNQLRNVITTDSYRFASEGATKTLYWEHIKPFVSLRAEVARTDETDITMKLSEVLTEPETVGFGNFLAGLST